MVERFAGEQELEDIWHEYIGSHHLSVHEELEAIHGLQRNRIFPKGVIYRLYLMTKYWKWTKLDVLKRDDYRCVKCGSRYQLHVDHIRYPGFGKEAPDDLQTLCFYCHADKTKKFDLGARQVKSPLVPRRDQLFELLRRKE